jgi:hypothetical protein
MEIDQTRDRYQFCPARASDHELHSNSVSFATTNAGCGI